jgi:hypothetical protein
MAGGGCIKADTIWGPLARRHDGSFGKGKRDRQFGLKNTLDLLQATWARRQQRNGHDYPPGLNGGRIGEYASNNVKD